MASSGAVAAAANGGRALPAQQRAAEVGDEMTVGPSAVPAAGAAASERLSDSEWPWTVGGVGTAHCTLHTAQWMDGDVQKRLGLGA